MKRRTNQKKVGVIGGSKTGSQLQIEFISIRTLLFCSLLGAQFTASSADADTALLTENDWAADIPMVVSATRQEQSILKAPSSVTIISREMIDALGANNIAELMRLVPGFQVFYSNGSTFGVTPHGFSDRDPRRMEVRINGRSVYLPQLSSTAWESLGLTPDDIAHIEVVRGSNVPAYGSNAILGAINITTLNPVKDSGGRVKVTGGSLDTRIVNARQYFQQGAVDGLVRSAYKENSGFDGVDDQSHVGHLALNGVYTPDLFNTLEFEVGFSEGEFGIGDGDHLDEFADDDRHSLWLHGNWEYTAGQHLWKLHSAYATHEFERHRAVLLSDIIGVDPAVIPFLVPGHVDEALELEQGKRKFSVMNVELEHHRTFGNGWRSVVGFGLRRDSLESERFVGGNGKTDSTVYYLFGNVEWQVSPDWVLNGGLMVEDKEGFSVDASPRISLNHHFSEQQHLRASLTRAYRQPALMEADRLWTIRFENDDLIDVSQRSHPDIDSERVDTAEIGYFGFWNQGKIRFDAKLFREEMRDGIDGVNTTEEDCLSPDPEFAGVAEKYCQSFFVNGEYGAPLDKRLSIFANASEWTVEGLELQLSYKWSLDSWLRFNYALLDAESTRVRSVTRPSAQVDDSVPRHTAGLLMSTKLTDDWTLSGFVQYTDLVKWRSGTLVDSYTRTDIKLSRMWRVGKTQTEVALVTQDLFNEGYLEYQRNNNFQRRAFLSISIQWP